MHKQPTLYPIERHRRVASIIAEIDAQAAYIDAFRLNCLAIGGAKMTRYPPTAWLRDLIAGKGSWRTLLWVGVPSWLMRVTGF
jgi:hypothetical protein